MPRPAVYHHLATRIRSDINRYANAGELPSLRSLARRYGASRNTIRRSLSLLVEQGEVTMRADGFRYLRRRTEGMPKFAKPYPAAALISEATIALGDSGYRSEVHASFVSALAHQIIVSIVAIKPWMHVRPIPDGAIVGPPDRRFSALAFHSGAPASMLAELVETGAVVMVLDGLSDVDGVDCVAVDCEHEAAMAVDYLAALGHREIAMLGPRQPLSPRHWPDGVDPDCRRFEQALIRAKQSHGLRADPAYHIELEMDLATSDAPIRAAVNGMSRLSPPPTAVICFDHSISSVVLTALQQRGLRCPADISVITRSSISSNPSALTSLASNAIRIGNAAAEHLLNRLHNLDTAPNRLLVTSELVEGTTTAPAPT